MSRRVPNLQTPPIYSFTTTLDQEFAATEIEYQEIRRLISEHGYFPSLATRVAGLCVIYASLRDQMGVLMEEWRRERGQSGRVAQICP